MIYYISPTGNNTTGNGTEGNPWQTLAYGLSQCSSGDTLFLLPGTYTITSSTAVPVGVSLKGAGESSVITSTSITANETPIIDMRSSSLIDGDQSISFLKFDGANLTATMAIWAQRRNNIKIHDCTFINFRDTGVWWEGDFAGWTQNIPPNNYTTGNEFFNNEVHNCAGHWGGMEGHGEGGLNIGGQEGMLIYNNVFTEVGRPDGGNGYPLKMYLKGGWVKGLKIFNNHFEKTDHTYWTFAIEGFRHFGIEIYNNRIIGTLDLNHIYKGEYDYGAYIHGNVIGPDEINSDRWIGMYLEFSTDEVIISKNRFKNCKVGISFTPRSESVISNYNINYNIFENLGAGSPDNWYGAIWVGQGVDPTSYSVENFNLYNNVFHTLTTGTERVYFGLEFGGSPSNNINIKNNIFINFAAAWLRMNPAEAVDGLNIENNVINNIGWGNNPAFVNGTPSNYVNQNNIFSNPLFADASNGYFQLQPGSPGIDAGTDVGLNRDYRGYVVPINSIPDIGAYEYGSYPPISFCKYNNQYLVLNNKMCIL